MTYVRDLIMEVLHKVLYSCVREGWSSGCWVSWCRMSSVGVGHDSTYSTTIHYWQWWCNKGFGRSLPRKIYLHLIVSLVLAPEIERTDRPGTVLPWMKEVRTQRRYYSVSTIILDLLNYVRFHDMDHGSFSSWLHSILITGTTHKCISSRSWKSIQM